MIYFIQQGEDGPIKIGYTTDDLTFHKRLSSMQTCSPVKLRILGIAEGDHKAEHELHERFFDACLQGEWFYPHQAITAHIDACARPIKEKHKAPKRAPSFAFDASFFVSCYAATKDKLKARAAQLGLSKYGDLVRWALRWAVHAPREELLKYSVEGEQE